MGDERELSGQWIDVGKTGIETDARHHDAKGIRADNTQEMGLRGLPLDKDSIRDALAIVTLRSAELEARFRELTGLGPLQHAKVKQWMHDRGCEVENLQADYIEEVLSGKHEEVVVPEGGVREALETRRLYNRASTKKLDAMLRNRGRDGRARWQTRYHGAITGRNTGLGSNPLNMSRGFEDVPPEELVRALRHRSPEWLDCLYGDAMEAVGKATRHHIRAEHGNRIIAADYVSVEAVVLSCLAGEEWKVEAFRRKDPVYEVMACEMFGLGDEALALARRDKVAFKDRYPRERQDGKQGELAFGYQGAVGAWRKLDPAASSEHTDERVVELCKLWRGKNPAIVRFWGKMNAAAVRCVRTGRDTEVGLISFSMVDEWLSMRVPSGKRIWYRDPQLRLQMPAWHKPDTYEDCAEGACDCEPVHALTYMAWKQRQWRRHNTYGGKLVENATQCTARELLVPAMVRLRDAGYPLILTVYDEVIAEVPRGRGSVQEFCEIMGELPDWAADWPVRVEGWEGERYKK